MQHDLRLDLPQWAEFEAVAREQGENAVNLLEEYIRDYLEASKELKLHQEIAKDVQATGYDEADAVELVRRMREERRTRGAAA